ncbi:unnamed protein product [Arctogadus glacialis]
MATRSLASITKLLPAELENLRSVLLTDLTETVSSLLANALAPLKASLDVIQSTMDLHARRITDVEAGLSDYSDRVFVLENEYATLKTEKIQLHPWPEDAQPTTTSKPDYRKNIRFGLLHPARLRGDYEGHTLYFDSPAAAQVFYDSHWHD